MLNIVIRGPRGEDGAAGAKGDQGDTGAKGDQGIQGIQGETGEQGASSYTHRGVVSTVDFDKDDLTLDDAFHQLDLSGIVGEAARLVLIRVRVWGVNGNPRLIIKTGAEQGSENMAFVYTISAATPNETSVWVMTSSTGRIDYKASVATWTSLDLVVRGWFG